MRWCQQWLTGIQIPKPDIYAISPPSTSTIVKIILPDKSCRTTGSGPLTVEALLRDLGIDPIAVIVARNGTLVTEDSVVENEDEVRIIRIAHGG
jgi:sulfur carrier protein